MFIESTIYVHKNIQEVLEKGAETIGYTRTSIIKILLQRVMKDNHKLLKSYSRIKYQERDEKENWHRLHIVLNEYEYEYCLDMRNFYKMSVSLILAYAVRRYLDEIVNELLYGNICTDNYLYKNYIFIKKTIDEVICWQICWGITQKLQF
jgi:hypothetical protein